MDAVVVELIGGPADGVLARFPGDVRGVKVPLSGHIPEYGSGAPTETVSISYVEYGIAIRNDRPVVRNGRLMAFHPSVTPAKVNMHLRVC